MINHMPAVRRFAAGDGPAAAAIIRGLPDYFTDDVPAKVRVHHSAPSVFSRWAEGSASRNGLRAAVYHQGEHHVI